MQHEAKGSLGPEGPGGYTSTQRRIEAVALVLLGLFAAALFPRLVRAFAGLDAWAAVAAIVLGWVAADFLSGVVHWLCDTWGRESWPVVGNGLIRGFREHHVDPRAITRHDVVETNGSVAAALLPLVALGLWLPAETGGQKALLLFLAASSGALLATNQIHKWAHQSDPPRPVRFLQRLRLLLPPDRHAVHHTPPFDRDYCITTGWLNRPLAALGFFRRLEGLVTFLSGATPRRHETASV